MIVLCLYYVDVYVYAYNRTLHCEGINVTPDGSSTGGKPVPVDTIARP